MEYKREELIALMREMEKQIALCHIRPQLAGALADELERSEHVVRCKDCKSGPLNPNVRIFRCNVLGCGGMKPDDFCSYGERKDGDG